MTVTPDLPVVEAVPSGAQDSGLRLTCFAPSAAKKPGLGSATGLFG